MTKVFITSHRSLYHWFCVEEFIKILKTCSWTCYKESRRAKSDTVLGFPSAEWSLCQVPERERPALLRGLQAQNLPFGGGGSDQLVAVYQENLSWSGQAECGGDKYGGASQPPSPTVHTILPRWGRCSICHVTLHTHTLLYRPAHTKASKILLLKVQSSRLLLCARPGYIISFDLYSSPFTSCQAL